MAETADLCSIDDFVKHWAAERPDATILEEGDEAITFA